MLAILANGWYYSCWVVGTSRMRAVENERVLARRNIESLARLAAIAEGRTKP